MHFIKKSRALFVLLFLLLFLNSGMLSAQEVILEQKPDPSANSSFGANKAWFAQVTLGVGTLVGTGTSDNKLSINDWRSNDLSIGIKMKRKINGLLSVWLEPEYHYASYNINQTEPKITDSLFWPNGPQKHEKERFATEGILVNAFLRFNFDPKRGNFLGYYLDLGAGSNIVIDREYLSLDKKSDGSEVRTSYSNIPYMNSIGYTAFARIGINWLAFTFNYRLSSLFKSQYNIPEPSAFTAGIEINPYSH
jgi:hypothetical protein